MYECVNYVIIIWIDNLAKGTYINAIKDYIINIDYFIIIDFITYKYFKRHHLFNFEVFLVLLYESIQIYKHIISTDTTPRWLMLRLWKMFPGS